MYKAAEGKTVRVCYLVQTHREPRQIARLVATLLRQSPGAFVLVVHDASACELDARAVGASDPRVGVLRLHGPIRRGYLSMLEPYLRGIEWLDRENVDYDWIVYLSGQDYPVRPLAEIERRLDAAECDGFLRFWPALGAGTPWRGRVGFHRYYYRYRDVPAPLRLFVPLAKAFGKATSLVHVHETYGARLGVRAFPDPFEGRVCYGGSQWTTLRRPCVEFVRESVQRGSALMDHYRRTVCPDESLVQTLLVSSGRFRLTNDNRRYVDFGESRDGRPRILGVADLDRITTGDYDFARKFDLDREPRVLDLLDERER